jgi:hypothetical protein
MHLFPTELMLGYGGDRKNWAIAKKEQAAELWQITTTFGPFYFFPAGKNSPSQRRRTADPLQRRRDSQYMDSGRVSTGTHAW